jgi:hypothetical protein
MPENDARPSLSAFSTIRRGMTKQAILASLGSPDRETAASAQVLEYKLADGSKVEILFVHPQLIKIIHYRLNGTKMTWVPT